MHTRDVFICGVVRTPHGKWIGALKDFSAAELGGLAIRALVEKHTVPREEVNGVYMGEVYTAGEGQNPARHAAVRFGRMPHSCPAVTINKVCSSSLAALESAFEKIQLGKAEVIIAGGMESMSRTPFFIRRYGRRTVEEMLPNLLGEGKIGLDRTLYDSMMYDGLTEPSYDKRPTMAVLSDECAQEHGIAREDQEFYAFRSCILASNAYRDGAMKDYVIPVALRDGSVIERDETLRLPDMEKIKKSSLADGCSFVTNATMSQLADGASAVLLASESAVKRFSLTPLARIVDIAIFSHHLESYPTAPAGAIEQLLVNNDL